MSAEGVEKLRYDLRVAEVMVEGMAGYLRGEALFGVTQGTMPKLTLGGYLMRQRRLYELRGLLEREEVERVVDLKARFAAIMQEQLVRSEQRAEREYQSRLRQWETYIRDLRRDAKAHFHYYATAVEPRAMIAELHDLLATPPYRLNPELSERRGLLDGGLKGIWAVDGEFVWPEAWRPAYPSQSFWWLYGEPLALVRSRR